MTSTSSTEEFQDAVEKPADLCTSDSEEYSDSDEVAANGKFILIGLIVILYRIFSSKRKIRWTFPIFILWAFRSVRQKSGWSSTSTRKDQRTGKQVERAKTYA